MTSISSSVTATPPLSPINRSVAGSSALEKPSSGKSIAAQADVKAAADDDPSASQDSNNLELNREQQSAVAKLAARDREVRAHEAAHANVGGVYAGAPTYTYQRGPDGNNYAVGGEVSIDVSPVPGDPQATITKAQVVRRAALAPAEPSPQDRAVASEALALEQNARQELLSSQRAEAEDEQSSDAAEATVPRGFYATNEESRTGALLDLTV